MTPEQYSRKATQDVRTSMAIALARHLESLWFNADDGAFQLARVFPTWATYAERYIAPSAVVLPGQWIYGDAGFTPTLIQSTWEHDQTTGYGLYRLSEIEINLEVSIRTNSAYERAAIMLGVEQSFVDSELLMTKSSARYGIILPMPEYYGLCGRYSLLGAALIDDEQRAMQENRDTIFTVKASAPQVRLGPAHPLNLTITQEVGVEVDVGLDDC